MMLTIYDYYLYNKVFVFLRTGKDYPIYSPSILCKINPRNPGCGKTKSGGGLRKNNASQNQNRASQNQNRAGNAGSTKIQTPGFPKKVN